MRKIVDGKVAVLISPGWGAGWSTWLIEDAEKAMFDTTLVDLVLDSNWDAVHSYAKDTYPEYVQSAVETLTVVWLPVGTEFYISEYDGNECIDLKEQVLWITA